MSRVYLRRSEWDRFWPKVEVGDCWQWTAAINDAGYGIFRTAADRNVRAHRWAFEMLVGPIPDGLTIDHLCRNTACVNPDHLEPVTQAVNKARSVPGRRDWRSKLTHCPRGHEYTEENTYVRLGTRGNFRKSCLECRRTYRVRKRQQW